jgi:thioredoxin 1
VTRLVLADPLMLTLGGRSAPGDGIVGTTSCTIAQLDDGTFEEAVRASSSPILVHFAQRDCEGCQMARTCLAGVVGRSRGPVNCFCVHAGKSPRVAARYRVEQYPTILVLRDGRVVRRLVGHPLPEELEFILRTELP